MKASDKLILLSNINGTAKARDHFLSIDYIDGQDFQNAVNTVVVSDGLSAPAETGRKLTDEQLIKALSEVEIS